MTSSNTNHRQRRLEALDLARSAGFLIVLLQHCLGFLGSAVPSHFLPQDATILDFFFLMSGFFAGFAYEEKLRAGQKSVAQALGERALRLFPLVALGTLLGVLSYLIWAPHKFHLLLLLTLTLKGFALIPANGTQLGSPDIFPLDGPLWFLLYDWFAYLLFLFALRHLSLKWLFAVTAAAMAGLWWAAISMNTLSFGTLWTDWAWSLPRSLAGFTTGYILFRLYKPGRFLISRRLGWLPALALLAVVLLPVPAEWRYSGALQAVIATLVMPMIIFFGAYVPVDAVTARLASVGAKIALPVYVLHSPVIRTLSLLRWYLHLHGMTGLALIFAEFLIPIALAYLVAKYLEKMARTFTIGAGPSPSKSSFVT
jgi:peptidoglycan/LPS O-acetylase OafA/YrhL